MIGRNTRSTVWVKVSQKVIILADETLIHSHQCQCFILHLSLIFVLIFIYRFVDGASNYTITCNASAQWEPSDIPFCNLTEKDCPGSYIGITNGRIDYETVGEKISGHEVIYFCDDDYRFPDLAENKTTVCNRTTKVYEPEAPTCERNYIHCFHFAHKMSHTSCVDMLSLSGPGGFMVYGDLWGFISPGSYSLLIHYLTIDRIYGDLWVRSG